MKLVNFLRSGRPGFGAVVGEGIRDLSDRIGDARVPIEAALTSRNLATLCDAAAGGAADLGFDEVTLLPAVDRPAKIIQVLLNYESARIAQGRPKLVYPHLMSRFADCLVAHDAPIVIPADSKEFDYEGEIAVVIGDGGRHIAHGDAMAHVAGYTCFMDGSARDWMRHTRHFTAGKNFPNTAGLGPWMLTADEVPDVAALELTTRINGDAVQHGRGDDLTFGIAELIAYISTFTPLSPGDVIATGSPPGAGYKRMPPRYLQPGDVVEVEITGVGTLRNVMAAEAVDAMDATSGARMSEPA